ncbi:MAG TPA: protein kinase [Vicinamibacteria bacterium]|nr:protein kinase [Vicinamibacteria bacterium]
MGLAVGARLGSCEVLGRIGAGGMGEVFCARDLRLGREVALKVLPEALSAAPERRRRFEREARLLASLNHPHIAAIHELVETAEGDPVLVLELVAGESLDVRISRGPLPLREALVLGSQIAEALEAAHELAILHRDLKPANVKLTREGKVKLLDFGLAKALGEAGDGPIASSLETLTRPAGVTAAGAVLGTPAYMSPEQARGETLDKRTDVWAFGCVLFEMLSGHRAFGGASRAEAIASVLDREPDWDVLPEATPVKVRDLLRRCLQKERSERLRDIADARIELREAVDELSSGHAAAPVSLGAGGSARAPRRAWPLWLAGLLVGGLTVSLSLWSFRPRRPVTPTRLTFSPRGEDRLLDSTLPSQHLALAPDGTRVAFSASSPRGTALYVRDRAEIEAKLIPDTDGALTPFFSPDGRWLGFAQGSRLMKVPINGGIPEEIAEIPDVDGRPGIAPRMRGASWGRDNTIVFAVGGFSGLWRVRADGGAARPLTQPDPLKGEVGHRWPQVLPDGRSVLFTIGAPSWLARDARIAVVSLETGRHQVILEATGLARYLPTGHLVYAKLGSVMAVPFDASRLMVAGPPVTALNDVQMALDGHFYADLDVSASGALVYVPGGPRLVESSLFWVDREGRIQPVTTRRGSWARPRLSPDGRRLSLVVNSDLETADIWILDLDRDAWERVTTGGWHADPVWSPDGQRLAFTTYSRSGPVVTAMPADGSGRPEVVSPENQGPYGLDEWSSDGQELVFSRMGADSQWDIGVQELVAGSSPSYLLASSFLECCAALSPDGRWMAYVSGETGDMEVYAQAFPGPGGRQRVSTQGGIQPRWSRDGRELFYRSTGDRPKIMAVKVEQSRGGLRVSRPRPLFDDVFAVDVAYNRASYDVAPDGRFIFLEAPPGAPAPRQIVLIPDFASELRRTLRAAGR